MQKWIIIGVIIAIVVATTVIVLNTHIETEYTPEIEIDESNLRKTIISLYFYNEEANKIEKEARMVDSKDLLKDPYIKVLNLLKNGPESEKLSKIIPEDTEIKDVRLDNGVLVITLTNNFLKVFNDEKKKDVVMSAISKTLTEFKEVNSISIIIENNGS